MTTPRCAHWGQEVALGSHQGEQVLASWLGYASAGRGMHILPWLYQQNRGHTVHSSVLRTRQHPRMQARVDKGTRVCPCPSPWAHPGFPWLAGSTEGTGLVLEAADAWYGKRGSDQL